MAKFEQFDFGVFESQSVEQYVLSNDNGMTVKVASYGATITSISVPNKDGGVKEIAAGFDTLEGYFSEDYRANAPYFGCTVGRFASRIKDGKFSINGEAYTLACNDGSNHLHGGLKGLDKRVWTLKKAWQSEHKSGIALSIQSPDMEEGFPGNITVTVYITLSNENEIVFEYEAETDKTTPLSFTNHTYFNLSGFKNTIENHKARIIADSFLAPDETNVPVGEIAEVKGTVADLNEGKVLKEAFSELETGFEHYYAFDKKTELRKVAEFSDTDSGTTLEVATTEPGALFYTGYFTSDKLKRENGDQFGRYRALCFETHKYPNGPNIEGAPDALTHPDEAFKSTTIYRLSW